MKIHLNQIDLISAISKEVEKQARAQKQKSLALPHCFAAIIEAATIVVAAFAEKDRPATPGMGLTSWLASHDTGISSKTMAAKLCGVGYPQNSWDHPYDNQDFGRCVRFLKAVPEARLVLDRMKEVSPQWAALIARWDELEGFYHAMPDSAELYARIKSCITT